MKSPTYFVLNRHRSWQFAVFLSLFGCIGALLGAEEAKRSAGVLKISDQPQLFLDDYLVAELVNLHRDMKHPTKHPENPLIRQEYPWEARVLEFYGTVVYEPEVALFRCWYMGSANGDGFPATPEARGLPEYWICYAESKDGIHWTKPMVGNEPRGPYKKHNIVIPGGHGISVLKTPADPNPARRYRAAGGDVYAFSADGINWEMHNWRPAVGKNDTGSSVVWWNGEYLAFVRNQEPESGTAIFDPATGLTWSGVMRGVGLSVSTDFTNWTPKKSVLRSDTKDGYPWGQPHAMSVTPYGDVLIGLLPMLHIIPAEGNNLTGDMDVQLTVSRDGRNWQRVADRAVFMPQEKSEPLGRRSWDMRFHPGSTMLVKDDVIYIYYYGTTVRWGEKSANRAPALGGSKAGVIYQENAQEISAIKFGIGLATLPADRFVSLRPLNWQAEGSLRTPALEFSGTELLINADCDPKDLQVEVVDTAGKAVPGFTGRESVIIRHDKLRFRVLWTDGARRRPLGDAAQATPVALRFTIRNGDLYAFQIATSVPK